jgi:hypothetical protein
VEGGSMATFLVDYENVGNCDGLHGVDVLSESDTLIIFYSQCCGKIRYDFLKAIKESDCDFKIMKLQNTGKNALDFYIAAECGVLSEKGETQLAIISKDKGFKAVQDFFKIQDTGKNFMIVKAGNIEDAIKTLNSPDDEIRRAEIRKRTTMLDLATEHARIEEKQDIKRRIKEALTGTEYEEKSVEIINFVDTKKNVEKKALYTSSLHSFGRKAGREIYQIVKQIVI